MTQQTAPSQRRPGIKTLLSVLNESSPLGTPEEEWEIALDLAHFEKISPWFVSRLSSSAISFSPALEIRLNTLQRDFTIRCLLLARRTQKLAAVVSQ